MSRILRLIPSLAPHHGGTVEALVQTTRMLTDFGHSVDVVCLDVPNAPWLSEMPFHVFALGPARGKYSFSMSLINWLNENAHSYDLCIVDGVWQFPGLAAWWSLRSRVPYFVYSHGMLDPWFQHTYPVKHLKKLIYWYLVELRVLQNARAVVYTCDEERVQAHKSFKAEGANEIVVPLGINGLTDDRDAVIKAFHKGYPQLKDKSFLLFLGRIDKKKGCDLLIEAYSERVKLGDKSALVMAGPELDQEYSSSLRKAAIELGISEHVVWTGSLRGAEKWGALASADAFVLPSHQENFGISVVEALSCGTPVLISNKVNIWDKIHSHNAGFVADDSLLGTKSLLQRWSNMSKSEKEILGSNALKLFRQSFEYNAVAEQLNVALMKESTDVTMVSN